MNRQTSLLAPAPHKEASGSERSPPSTPRGRVVWLFATRERGSPSSPRSYYLLSAFGVAGFVGLLILSTLYPSHCAILRVSAIGWFLIFGALRFWLAART